MRLEIETRRFYLGRDYCEAVEAVGGLPVHVPLIPEEGYISTLLDSLDGILLPGCDSDVDPAYYGEDPHPKLKRVVPEKDSTDMLILSKAEERKMPVLAICYGMQVLNVSRGGNLIQDIGAQVDGSIQHEQGIPLDRNSHDVKVDGESRLGRLLDDDVQVGPIKVNSHHHQAIRNVGRDLRAVAWANDGIVEGIEDMRPDRFVMGLQWHPELSWKTDELSHAIFENFVRTCASSAIAGVATGRRE